MIGDPPTGAVESRRESLEATCLKLGVVLYLVSFFLPAVMDSGHGSGLLIDFFSPHASGSLQGWECAWQCLLFGVHGAPTFLASGLINPLILAYFVLRVGDAAPRIRMRIGIVAMALIPVTWIVIATTDSCAQIGHVLWIGGMLLMVGPGIWRGLRGD
jgi:hypothetical protein